MHYGIFCPNEECGKLAFRLRPGLKPDDLENIPLQMGHFLGKHPLDYIACPHCQYLFQGPDFTVRKLQPLGEE